jgi:hypothetical protein
MQAPSDPTADRQARRDAYLDEHGTWEAARGRFASPSEDMDEDLCREALAALEVLERELGPTWPRDAMFVEDGPGAFLGNAAPWTARQVVVVAQDFELLKDDEAWRAVAGKLRKPRDGHSRSSLFQIHVAALARRRGLQVSLEPPSANGKFLDVLVRDDSSCGRGESYIECTENQAIPDVAQDASDGAWKLWPFDLALRGLQARVDLEPNIDPAQRAEAEERIARLYDEVGSEGEPQEIAIKGVLRAWASPTGHPQTPAYAATRGAPGLYETFEHDPVQRLVATVRKKLRQLRPDAANVIAIRPSRLLSQVPLDRIRQSLREAQAPAPMLSAVALFHQFWGHHTPSTRDLSEGDNAIITDLFTPYQEEVIVIWNPARRHTGADAVIRQHLAPDLGAWIDV